MATGEKPVALTDINYRGRLTLAAVEKGGTRVLVRALESDRHDSIALRAPLIVRPHSELVALDVDAEYVTVAGFEFEPSQVSSR